MLLNILNILSYVLLIYGMYYAVTSVMAFKNYKKKIIPNSEAKNKFKVLVACRNEQEVIGELITSIYNQNYPKDKYQLYVIPNNCTDQTKQIAESMNANIIDCISGISCKGDALKYAFSKLEKDEFDAYVVFDADNVVHPDFLQRMNDAIEVGYKVAQGYRDSKNAEDNWLSGSYSLFYWMQNFFFNRSRQNMKQSASINGTGYMVKKEVIDTYGFNTVTMTEDIEFTAQCAINDVKIAFVEDAITYDEQPVTWKASWTQRKRWSMGAHKCLKVYGKQLISKFFKKKSMPSIDMLFNFLAPVVQVVSTLLMVVVIAIKIAMRMDIGPLTLFAAIQITGIHIGILTYLANIAMNVFLVIYNKRKVTGVIPGVLLYSFFVLTWIPINFVSIFSKNDKWKPIEHTRSIGINEIIKEEIIKENV